MRDEGKQSIQKVVGTQCGYRLLLYAEIDVAMDEDSHYLSVACAAKEIKKQ